MDYLPTPAAERVNKTYDQIRGGKRKDFFVKNRGLYSINMKYRVLNSSKVDLPARGGEKKKKVERVEVKWSEA